MKTSVVFVIILLICGGLFFFAPHHRRKPNSSSACTLSDVYRDFFAEMPSLNTPRTQMFLLLGIAGVITSFYPALLVLMVRWLPLYAGQTTGGLFVLGGLIAAAGAFANFIAIVVSHMSFGFGANSSSGDETFFCFFIPIFQAAFAIVSVVIGLSAPCAAWAGRLVAT